MKNKYFRYDRVAMRIAERHNLVPEYKLARRKGYTPQEALEDWDMILPEEDIIAVSG